MKFEELIKLLLMKGEEWRCREWINNVVVWRKKKVIKIKEWMYGGNFYNVSNIWFLGFLLRYFVEERKLEDLLYDLGRKRMIYILRYDNEWVVFIEN